MIAQFYAKIHFLRAMKSKPFALLWISQTISLIGDSVYITVLAWTVLVLTNSASAMSLVVILQVIPTLLFVLVGGVIADRVPRRLVMIWSDTARAVFVLLLALISWLHLLQFWHLVLLSILFGCADSFFTPSYKSIRPQLVDTEALPSANALTVLSQRMSLLIGPILGAGCFALGGSTLAFILDGLTFVFSVFCLFAIKLPASASSATKIRSSAASYSSIVQRLVSDVREGFSSVKNTTWLWVTILIAAVANIGYSGPLTIALPKLVHDIYHTGVWLLGVIGTAGAIGAITASLVIGQVHHLPWRGRFAYAAVFAAGLSLIIFGLPLPQNSAFIIVSIASALAGFSLTIFQTIWMTLLQELVPIEKLGRVSSIDTLGSYSLLPLGFAAIGILTDHIGPSWVFVAGGLLVALLAVIALFVRDIRYLS